MPAEITASTPDGGTEFQIVLPGYAVPVHFYDPEEDANGVIMVRCGSKDYASDIFVFEEPADYAEGDEERLLEHCDEDSFLDQLAHGGERIVDTLSRMRIPAQLAIRHSCSMSVS